MREHKDIDVRLNAEDPVDAVLIDKLAGRKYPGRFIKLWAYLYLIGQSQDKTESANESMETTAPIEKCVPRQTDPEVADVSCLQKVDITKAISGLWDIRVKK